MQIYPKDVSVLSNFRDSPNCNHKFTLTQPRTRDIVGTGRLPQNEMQKLLHQNLLNIWQNNKGDKRMAQGIAAFLPLYSYSKLI